MKRTALLMLPAAIGLAACGSASPSVAAGQTSAPSRSATQSTAWVKPFAILQWHQANQQFGPDTVAIVRPDRSIAASARFQPAVVPYIGCMGPILPTQAYVAGDKVFYLDGSGTVRSLSPSGDVETVTRFPITSPQQEGTFAVSPDGTHLLGAVLTFPPKPASTAQCAPSGGNYSEVVYTARAGSPSVQTWQQSWSDNPMFVEYVGWDAVGPLAASPAGYGTQGGPAVHFPGLVVRATATGSPGNRLADPASCTVSDVVSDGSYVCVYEGGVAVHHADGSQSWGASLDGCCLYGFLSPDKRYVAVLGPASNGPNRPDILGADGSHVAAGQPFMQEGWLDDNTLIGMANPQLLNNELATVDRRHPATVADLSLAGSFVGVLP